MGDHDAGDGAEYSADGVQEQIDGAGVFHELPGHDGKADDACDHNAATIGELLGEQGCQLVASRDDVARGVGGDGGEQKDSRGADDEGDGIPRVDDRGDVPVLGAGGKRGTDKDDDAAEGKDHVGDKQGEGLTATLGSGGRGVLRKVGDAGTRSCPNGDDGVQDHQEDEHGVEVLGCLGTKGKDVAQTAGSTDCPDGHADDDDVDERREDSGELVEDSAAAQADGHVEDPKDGK